MKSKRYTEEQIIRILQEVESGNPVATVCRQYGVSEATVHRWRSKYKGMDQASLKRLRELANRHQVYGCLRITASGGLPGEPQANPSPLEAKRAAIATMKTLKATV